jgi:hypothetical protein
MLQLLLKQINNHHRSNTHWAKEAAKSERQAAGVACCGADGAAMEDDHVVERADDVEQQLGALGTVSAAHGEHRVPPRAPPSSQRTRRGWGALAGRRGGHEQLVHTRRSALSMTARGVFISYSSSHSIKQAARRGRRRFGRIARRDLPLWRISMEALDHT